MVNTNSDMKKEKVGFCPILVSVRWAHVQPVGFCPLRGALISNTDEQPRTLSVRPSQYNRSFRHSITVH